MELLRLSPSIANSQPWKLRVLGDDRLMLRHDLERWVRPLDRSGRALEQSVGCALEAADFVESADPASLDAACLERSFVMPFFLDFSGPSP